MSVECYMSSCLKISVLDFLRQSAIPGARGICIRKPVLPGIPLIRPHCQSCWCCGFTWQKYIPWSIYNDLTNGWMWDNLAFLCYGYKSMAHFIYPQCPWMFPVRLKSGDRWVAAVCRNNGMLLIFLAATKQLYKWYFPSVCPSVRLSVCPSVRLSVRLSHLFDYVPLIVSSWNFQELLLMTKVRSMQKDKVRGERSRSQRSQPNLTVSGL